MVKAYTETLVKSLLKVEQVITDDDGDIPIRYKSALYYIRVVDADPDEPIVQIFAVAVADIKESDELLKALNDINARLHFARAFLVREQVLIEVEIPGAALSMGAFSTSCDAVARAADHFGVELAKRFGGRTAFEDSKDDSYRSPGASTAGYL